MHGACKRHCLPLPSCRFLCLLMIALASLSLTIPTFLEVGWRRTVNV